VWKADFRENDQVVLFDVAAKRVELVEVMRTATTDRTTPDGRHFIAFKQVRGSFRRRIRHTLWTKLREAGVVTTAAEVAQRKLSEGRFNRLVEAAKLL
jgi:hypothetical protein